MPEALKVALPIHPRQIIRYSLGKPLDFAPGTAYAYSNFGYCVLGRVIEAVAGKAYEEVVTRQVLQPVGIQHMRLGKNLLRDRAPREVKYYDSKHRTSRAISGPHIGKEAPLPYGVECIETMDANGGWIASAVDLMRFAVSLDDPGHSPLLSPAPSKPCWPRRRVRSATAPRASPSRSITAAAGRSARARVRGRRRQIHQMARGPGRRQLDAVGLPR